MLSDITREHNTWLEEGPNSTNALAYSSTVPVSIALEGEEAQRVSGGPGGKLALFMWVTAAQR